MEQPEILLVAFALSGLTFFLSPLMMAMPKKELVAWGILLRNDSIIAMIAIGTVSSIQLLLEFVQKMITQSAGSALATPASAYGMIMGQLVGIDAALIAIVGLVSAVPNLQGFSILLGHMLGPSISAVTGSIVLWTVLQAISNVMPTLFLTLFSAGLCLWSTPFRIGRQAGSSIMSLAMVLFVGLPLAAPSAIWMENYVLTSHDLDNLTGISNNMQSNILDPSFLSNLIITNLAEIIARVLSGLVIALIVFPVMFLALLGFFARSLSMLIGGSPEMLPLRGV
ncbi:MAG: hypothetical protein HY295_00245 [Thaumarchaeota archaeon]|nr:hypothetical protein [Nitrososphaerota archaeon]